ncbi:hypothetical protein Angca_007799, partial [Angiostrongylus cantonensis]
MNLLVEHSFNGARQRNLLRFMLNCKVFKFGEFVLKSGMKSPIYIDLRECFGYADLMDLASDGIKYLIQETDTSFDGIVGVPYAALPYATLVSFRYKKPLIIIRKEAKTYGTKKLVEGVYDKGAKVIVIEDVVTTGGSIREVVNTLRAEGLVVENVFCILDREQGAAAKLKEDGITLYSLINMEAVICFLRSVGVINAETCSDIIAALNLSYKEVTLLQISTEMEDLASLPVQNLARLPLHERAKEALCSLNKKIFSLMLKKNSNLCLAVDYAEADKIIQLVEKAGPFVIAIKVHADAIVDFSKDFTTRLVRLAKDHEFFIFEDRKFGDTGNTNLLQLKGALHVAEWADLVTVYATQGFESIGPAFRQVVLDPAYRLSGILLIAQLSTKGCLTSLPGYTQAVTEMGEANQDVVCGFICQARVSSHPHMLHWTPGVNLDATSDSAGQQWRDLNEVINLYLQAIIRQQNDIVIVGRGVTSSASPIQELTRYREAGWTAL